MATEAPLDLAALGDDFARDPYPTYERLRAQGPVHRVWMPEGAEVWLVVGHAEARAALTDPRLSKQWKNAAADFPISSPSGSHMMNSDPPQHTRLRKLVAREFTPRRIEALRPRVQEITDELLDKMLAAPDGRADLVDSFSFPLPISVICELMGVPFLDQAEVRRWADAAISAPDPAVRRAAAADAAKFIAALVEEKRSRPGEDLLSALIRTVDEEGDRLSLDELMGTVFLVIVAGHETTTNLIGNGVCALLENPDQLADLRADFALLEGAVEEMLRYDGAVESATFRFAVEPLEMGGRRIERGEAVMVDLNAANRDGARFADPDRFDIRRPTAGHVAFGHGVHHCLGAPLARMEARIAIRSLLERCPRLELDADPHQVPWRHGILVRGPHHLPVRFGAA
ncbi:cytochrome P450 family protein [Streptomyces paromomycinus]|uniref:Cytochrome P450 n=1 Tax=Streptomyces paromomycinus TaxID=92743 RepID=A0A401WDK8_STREY|nr:cytochrome P450 [Streptomyces paromomycinus]GCD47398.1 cytochrome P450 [Streptomyces paromomycinus]